MKKCRQFLEGLPTFQLITDHMSPVPILNEFTLDRLDNPRLLRLKLKMQRYSFQARWIPGKQNADADALSRAPVDIATPMDEIGDAPPANQVRLQLIQAIEGSDPAVLDPVLEAVAAAAARDPVMIQLRNTITTGFPNNKCNLPKLIGQYWCVRDRLAVDDTDDMIVVGSRLVVPQSIRRRILKDLVQMHQGATKLRQRARLTLFWPGMDADIEDVARCCDECVSRQPSLPAEPLRPHPPATRPFEQVT